MQKEKVVKRKKRGYAGPKLRNYSIYVREDLIKRVDEEAGRQGVSRSWEIEELLTKAFGITNKETETLITRTEERDC